MLSCADVSLPQRISCQQWGQTPLKFTNFWGAGDSVDSSGIFAYNELVFLQLVYSYGMIVGIVLVLLLGLFIMRAMKIVRAQKNQLGALVSATCFFPCVSTVVKEF